MDDYARFIKIKGLPQFGFQGRTAIIPDEYADQLGVVASTRSTGSYTPIECAFDYQRGITAMAIRKRRFAVFADCGLGKTLMILEFARYCKRAIGKRKHVLIVSPLMVVPQTIGENDEFYGDDTNLEQVHASELSARLKSKAGGILITNYDALKNDTPQGNIGALILDESSMLKSHYGAWAQDCLRLGAGIEWKLACTGTPAPNDRIEYANHAVFLGAFPTVNAFLARYFVNRGQTDNRWELKPHALRPFYRSLSHWCIFLTNPATYGWKNNCQTIPPIHIHVDRVGLTDEQTELAYDQTSSLFADRIGGITSRSVLGQIAKGSHKGKDIDTLKPAFIRRLVESWPTESTIIWCKYNAEQDLIASTFPDAANISGSTPHDKRLELVADFKARRRLVLISKPRILGFGLNLQVATRQVFSGLQDSYEEFYQAVKRSNRIGSTKPLNVHIPVTDIERPMIETVLRKADRVQHDTEEQEQLFKECGYDITS